MEYVKTQMKGHAQEMMSEIKPLLQPANHIAKFCRKPAAWAEVTSPPDEFRATGASFEPHCWAMSNNRAHH